MADNILFITPHNPFSGSFGGSQRSKLLWDALREYGNVYVVYEVENMADEYVDHENKVAGIYFKTFCRKWITWVNEHILFPVFPVGPGMGDTRCLKKLENLFQVRFDKAVCRYMLSVFKFRPDSRTRVYIDIDDLPEDIFRIHCAHRKFLRIRRAALLWWSRYLYRRAAGVWITNPAHRASICCKNIDVLPNIPQEPRQVLASPPPEQRDNRIMTVGLLCYKPNIDGIEHFLEYVWPTVHEKFPTLEYHIIGGGLPEKQRKQWEAYPNVKIRGYVPSLDEEYCFCQLTVAPVYAGGGTCIKVLESMRHGRVCIGPPSAMRGLEAFYGQGIFSGVDETDFAEKIVLLLRKTELRLQQEKMGIDVIKAHFTKEIFMKQVRTVLSRNALKYD